MKKLSLFTLVLVAAGSALGESPTPDDTASHVFAQPKTRAQVQAELMQARADGSIKVWSTQYNPLQVAQSTKSRADVLAALHAARANGELGVYSGEDSGSSHLARVGQTGGAGIVFAAVQRGQ